MDTRTLSFNNINIRSAQSDDGRTVEGIAVPFGKIIDYWGSKETFDRDCVFQGIENAKLCYQHGELIGRITSAEPRDEGLYIQARIADTATGRDVVSLLNDGALDSFSVGFIPVDSTCADDSITHYKNVRLLETSIVSFPAYSEAKITDHRNNPNPLKENTMETDITKLMEQVNERGAQLDQLTELTRGLQARLDTPQAAKTNPLGDYDSFGGFVKQLYAGDEQARSAYDTLMTRAVTSANAGMLSDTDSQPQWVADHIRLVQSARTVTNLITHEALPDKGMKLDYLVMGTDSTQVKQFNEGEDLAFGKVTLSDASAQVVSFGGYTSVSRHTIDRATTPYLDVLLRAMALTYSKYTENATRTTLYEAIAAIQDNEKLKTAKALSAMKVTDWVGLIIDAAEELDERAITGVTLGVSKNVYAQLATLSTGDRPLMDISGNGPTQVGTLNITGVTGTLMNYSVQLLPKATDNTAAFISKDSVTMWESSNAPFQLQADRAIDLARDMSLYGYAAYGVTNPAGLLPIKFGE